MLKGSTWEMKALNTLVRACSWRVRDSGKVRNKPQVTIQKRNDQFKSDIQQGAERRCQACA